MAARLEVLQRRDPKVAQTIDVRAHVGAALLALGGRQGGAAAGPLVPVDYGVGKQGQVVIGGHWGDASELDPTIPHAFQPSSGIGWDQPDPRELDPLTAEEAASCPG